LERDNIERFLAELEEIKFDKENNEFETTECVICMENFTHM